jgi:hypothetical protein
LAHPTPNDVTPTRVTFPLTVATIGPGMKK